MKMTVQHSQICETTNTRPKGGFLASQIINNNDNMMNNTIQLDITQSFCLIFSIYNIPDRKVVKIRHLDILFVITVYICLPIIQFLFAKKL